MLSKPGLATTQTIYSQIYLPAQDSNLSLGKTSMSKCHGPWKILISCKMGNFRLLHSGHPYFKLLWK